MFKLGDFVICNGVRAQVTKSSNGVVTTNATTTEGCKDWDAVTGRRLWTGPEQKIEKLARNKPDSTSPRG